MPKRVDPAAIARWRYDQIEEALGEDLASDVRGEILRRISRTPVRWPSGATRQISLATLYRWCRCYAVSGLAGLRPAPRKDAGRPRRALPDQAVSKAVAFLASDPGLSFTLLLALLRPHFGAIARSTLQRRLARDPLYTRLQRTRRLERRRRRFVAKAPHEIWQLDALGPVSLRLESGETISFHILTVLDDATRAVLATIVAPTPDLASAVRVFRRAARRWGLPSRFYADRASIFDSHAFRQGLAELGAHRIRTRPGNAPAHGKIEAFHRTLRLWFVGRLPTQRVIDLQHLQELLEGVIGGVYQTHHHRGLKISPAEALAGRASPRGVSAARLDDAFREERWLKSHGKTGEVEIHGKVWLVPDELRGQRLAFRIDPEREAPPVVVTRARQSLPLQRAAIRPADAPAETREERWAPGPLQALRDAWQGKVRPLADAGFGLPELFELLTRAVGRPVPTTDVEAALVQQIYRDIGPLAREATVEAFRAIEVELGAGRPVARYLDALRARVAPGHHKRARRRKRHE